ncbi:MAG: glycosyltransferase [Nostocoides sp.]
MTDLVLISLERWDEVWRRNQHLVAGLLRAGQVSSVLFIEPATDIVHALRRGRRPGRAAGLRRHEVGVSARGQLWLFQPRKLLPRRVDQGHDGRWARGVMAAATRAGLTHPVLWVNDPMGAEVMELTGWPTLYDITDDWLAAHRPAAEHARLNAQEQRLLAGADDVVVCSPDLAERKVSARPVTMIRNGVDLSAYAADPPRPTDLPAGPVALYAGTLHRDRLDVPLCLRTAHAIAGAARVVAVGPVLLDRGEQRRLQEAGVVLLGARPAAEVPAYLRHAKVLLVPHVIDDFTMSLDPIKRYEYAAAGRPIVATAVSGFIDDVALTVPAEQFPQAVADVLSGQRRPADPRWAAAEADWSARVEEMAAVLRRLGRPGHDTIAL